VAASFSFAGSNHEFRNTTVQVAAGLTLCAPSSSAFAGPTMSGIGKPPMKPILFDFVVLPAATPATKVPS